MWVKKDVVISALRLNLIIQRKKVDSVVLNVAKIIVILFYKGGDFKRSQMLKENSLIIRLKPEEVVEIPKEVAVCPICRGTLYASCDQWAEENKDWVVDSINMDCETEPDIDSDNWQDWFTGHYSAPYIDWLPVEKIVIDWLNKNYRWNLDVRSK